MATNVTTAVFGEGCNTATASPSLAQWDKGQVLQISGVDLPDAYQVEFSTVYTRNAIPMIGNASGVQVPNELLQRSAPITACIVLHGATDSRETEYWVTIHITPRKPPETTTPDPEQEDALDQAIAALEAGAAKAEAAAEAIQDMNVEAETLAEGSPASVEKTVDPETGAVTLNFGLPKGEKGNPGTPGQDGTTPNFRIGTVTTLPPESPAEATITGTPAQPVLNLGIPQGEKGEPGGGSGTSDYTQLSNKPQINGHTLDGNQSADDLGLGTYSKPASGIPKTDLASDVQASLGKADTALQTAPVTSVAGKTGAVQLNAGDVGFNSSEEYNEGTVGAKLSALNRHLSDLDDEKQDAPSTAGTAGQVLGLDSNLNPAWMDQTGGGGGGMNIVSLSGTQITQVGADNTFYVCGELTELTFTAPSVGITGIRFTSGTTPTVLTISGVTAWMFDFDPTTLEADTTYEINVLNGIGVAGWA